MTREQAEKLKIFQIVRYNITPEECTDGYEWCLPYCGKLAIITQKIIWDDGGEEIHLRFPEKKFNQQVFYDTIEDLLYDFNVGRNITFDEGFDIGADSIDWIDYDRHLENDEKEKEIINEVIRRRDRAIKEKVRRAQSPSEIENNPVVMSAYDFYRGIEYELNKLLGWLGYEE